MRCRECGKKAVIKTVRGPLCEEHFKEHFERFVLKAIEDFKMFKRNEKIICAVSGGKDSLSLALSLKNLGFHVILYHIDLKIGEYSKICVEKVKKFSRDFGFDLFIEESEVKIRKIGRRSPCSVCGIVKRYLTNKFAVENKGVLATGHHMDDFLTFFFNLVSSGNVEEIKRLYPVLEEGNKLARRVKPLILLSEKECMTYAILNKIDFVRESCPLSINASHLKWKKRILNFLPEIRERYQILRSFLKMIKALPRREIKLRECKLCGYPTTSEICAYCRLKMRKDYKE